MARVLGVTGHRQAALSAGWELTAVPAGAAREPADLVAIGPRWLPAPVPGTAAAALRAAGRWRLGDAQDFDEEDWWYRCRFELPPSTGPRSLQLGGLATVADLWLNDRHVLHASNMFVSHTLAGALRDGTNELHIRFHALRALLQERRPRPQWRTRLVAHPQLRWFRTTLLGRMPGWCPAVAPVGPWRPVGVSEEPGLSVEMADLRPTVEGQDGMARVRLRLRSLGAPAPRSAVLRVGPAEAPLACQIVGDGLVELSGELRVPHVDLWWPHTHGAQPLYDLSAAVSLGGEEITVDLGRTGFRTVRLLGEAEGGFALQVNGAPIFCRGACWATGDIVTLTSTPEAYRAALETARAAGMNMLRVGGTMCYESDTFYDLCDELGILVWQDFMFASMDYPSGDEGFVASVRQEAAQLLDRLQGRPCLALLCGSSEVEQQAAMLGLPRERWTSPLFRRVLPAVCRALGPDVPYWPSSPSGGELPFQVNTGAAHYYGVGAYLRPLEDARRSEVRFASECLGFSNVPDDGVVDAVLGDGQAPVHHPAWKARVPRDPGAGWDFEDVRDHYLRLLFGLDPVRLRSTDRERYLALSRVVTGEVMAATFAEWRRARSTCRGGLVWIYQDLWPGAGWGVLDSAGRPKAAYYYLRRAFQPVAVFLSDEGLSGLAIHVVNDGASALPCRLRLGLYRRGEIPVATAVTDLVVPPRAAVEVPAAALLDGFLDASYAYRFGPPAHDLTAATLSAESGERLGAAFHFPLGLPSGRESSPGLTATATPASDGAWQLTVRTQRFAQAVHLDVPGFRPDDNYFHLEPGGERRVHLAPEGPGRPLRGSVSALNSAVAPVPIILREGFTTP